MSANGIISGGQSAPLHERSEVSSSSASLMNSLSSKTTALKASIRSALPGEHLANNDVIESRNEKLSNFLKSVKQTLKNPSLAEADITNSFLSHDLSYEGLPEDLVAPIRAEFERLPTEKQTFGALRDIVLENKQEEKCVLSYLGTRLMQLVVDYGTTDFTTTPNELTAKNKTHTIAQIKETFSKNSPVMGALLATGKLLETVYKTTADKGLVGKYNLIDQCAKTFRDKVHDGSSRTITKLAVTLLGTPILLGFKLASKAARIGLGAIAVVVTIAAAAGLGICLAAAFLIKESVQLVGRKIGYYDNEANEYCEYKFKEASEQYKANRTPENLVDMIKYGAATSPLCQVDVSRKFVKEMENDTAYQEVLKAKKEAAKQAKIGAGSAGE
jgi:hypothetical protein